jgi:hypothetical protein
VTRNKLSTLIDYLSICYRATGSQIQVGESVTKEVANLTTRPQILRGEDRR